MSEVTNAQVAAWLGRCTHPTRDIDVLPSGQLLCAKCGEQTPSEGEDFSAPDYLHDLVAAGLVLERLRKRGCAIEINTIAMMGWRVRLDPLEYGSESVSADGDTLPEAICRAALALGNQIVRQYWR